jgi:hypothetical protein
LNDDAERFSRAVQVFSFSIGSFNAETQDASHDLLSIKMEIGIDSFAMNLETAAPLRHRRRYGRWAAFLDHISEADQGSTLFGLGGFSTGPDTSTQLRS